MLRDEFQSILDVKIDTFMVYGTGLFDCKL